MTWEPGVLWVFSRLGRPAFLQLCFHGRAPICPVAYDRIETVPVVLAPTGPPRRHVKDEDLEPAAPVPAPPCRSRDEWPDAPAWLADILNKE